MTTVPDRSTRPRLLTIVVAMVTLAAACSTGQRPTLEDPAALGVAVVDGSTDATTPGGSGGQEPGDGSTDPGQGDGGGDTTPGPTTPESGPGGTGPIGDNGGEIRSGETAPDSGIVTTSPSPEVSAEDAAAAGAALDAWLDSLVRSDWGTAVARSDDALEVWSRARQQRIRLNAERGAIITTSEQDRSLRAAGGSGDEVRFAGSTRLRTTQQVLTRSDTRDTVLADLVVRRVSGGWAVVSAVIDGGATRFHAGGETAPIGRRTAVLVGGVTYADRTTVLVQVPGGDEPGLFVDDAELFVAGGGTTSTVEGLVLTRSPIFIVYSHPRTSAPAARWRAQVSIDGEGPNPTFATIAFDL